MTASAKPCAICHTSDVAQQFTKFGFDVVKCRSCGLVYLNHSMTPDDLRDFYSKEYFSGGEDRKGYADYVGDEDSIRRSFREKVRTIESLHPRGTILDIGCAAGFFMDEAAAMGWEVYGQEVSEYAGGVARERHGDHVFIGTIDAVDLPPKSMDVVTMWDVIEHLDDPRAVLARIRELLKDDGLFAVCTGDIDSWIARLQGRRSRIFNPPQHLYYYSKDSLARMLGAAGFQARRQEIDRKVLSLEYFFYVVSCLNSNPVTRFLHRQVGRLRLGKRAIRMPLPDNQVVYAALAPVPGAVSADRASAGGAAGVAPREAVGAGSGVSGVTDQR